MAGQWHLVHHLCGDLTMTERFQTGDIQGGCGGESKHTTGIHDEY
jgi:hypothetical protein